MKKEAKSTIGNRQVTGWRSMLFAAGLTAIFVYSNCFAETAEGVYSSKKDAVIESGIYDKGRYIFSCGKARIRKETTSARNRALSKSRTKALIGFYKTMRLSIKWPNGLNKKLHDPLFEQFITLSSIKLEVSKAVKVDSGFLNDEICYTVLAVPKENIEYDALTYSRIISTLHSAFENSDKRLNSSLYLEICPVSKIGRVIPKLAVRLGNQYGANVRAVVKGEFFGQPPDFTVINKIDSLEGLEGLKYDGLFGLLDMCPYFPKVCYLLGKRMYQHGKLRNASLFFQRGTIWKIDDEFNERCEKSVTNRYPGYILPESHKQVFHLKDKVIDSYQSSHYSFGPNSEGVINSFGTIPIKNLKSYSGEFDKGKKLFFSSPPDIDGALVHFISEIEQNISADGCNFIGRCFIEKNQHYLAIPYLLQATFSNPSHGYAWVNLALIFDKIGLIKTAKEFAQAAEATGNLDTWGEEQIQLLLQQKEG